MNRYLLEEMARIGRGAVEVVRPDEDTRGRRRAFHDRIARPLLTDVRIDWGGLDVRDHVPRARSPTCSWASRWWSPAHYRQPGRATVTLRGAQGRTAR